MIPHSSLISRALMFALLLLSSCQGPLLTAVTPVPGMPPALVPSATSTPAGLSLAGPTATAFPLTPSRTPLPRLEQPILWYLRGNTPADLPKINERLNRALALRGFNAQVEMRVLERGVYDQRMDEMERAGQPFDLFSLNASRYLSELGQQGLLPLSAYRDPRTGQEQGLLNTAASGLWASLPSAGWAAVRREGTIFAVPVPSAWAKPRGVAIRADVVRALGLQPELDAVRDFAGLTPVLEKIQSAIRAGTLKERGVADADNARQVFAQADLLRPEIAGYDMLALPFAVRYNDSQLKPVNWYQTPEFRDLAELRRAWQVAGYAPELPLSPEEIVTGYQSGKYLAVIGVPVWPGSAAGRAAQLGYTWLEWPVAPVFVPSSAPLGMLIGVNAHIAGDPLRVRRVLMLLEYLYTDPEIANLLLYGIEGEHWTWADRDQQVVRRLPGARYQPDYLDQLGGRSLAYALAPEQASTWAKIRQQNEQSTASAAMGFLFDPRPVAGQVAALQALSPEWLSPLANGQAKDIGLRIQNMNKAFGAAGIETLEAELVRQLEAWRIASIIPVSVR